MSQFPGVRDFRVAEFGDSGLRSLTRSKKPARVTFTMARFNWGWRIHSQAHPTQLAGLFLTGYWLDDSVPCHMSLFSGLLTTWKLVSLLQSKRSKISLYNLITSALGSWSQRSIMEQCVKRLHKSGSNRKWGQFESSLPAQPKVH